MLTEKQKQIAVNRFNHERAQNNALVCDSLFAAVEAVLAEQASAAEQGQACTNCGHHNPHTSPAGDVADACNEADCNCGYYAPAQPPAGDVVKRMLVAYHGCKPHPDNNLEQHMAAALAVAREGYVSLEDVEKAIYKYCEESVTFPQLRCSPSDLRQAICVHLPTKPAEQTPEQKVEAILTKHFHHIGVVDAAAEIVAALRDGKEGK